MLLIAGNQCRNELRNHGLGCVVVERGYCMQHDVAVQIFQERKEFRILFKSGLSQSPHRCLSDFVICEVLVVCYFYQDITRAGATQFRQDKNRFHA